MTVNEAIARAAALSAEELPHSMLLGWLAEIENSVITEIAATHEGRPYKKEPIGKGDEGRTLFAPHPFSELYVYYLIMKSDEWLSDTERYISSAQRFSAAYASFADWYNRSYMPIGEERLSV